MQFESMLKADTPTQPRPTMWKSKLSKENMKALESIKEIIETEEERDVTLDQTLSRVLSHYRQFVPFELQR